MRIIGFLLFLTMFSACDRFSGDLSGDEVNVGNPENAGMEMKPEQEPVTDNGDPFLISKARVGKITKGMTLKELIQAYGEEAVKFDIYYDIEMHLNPVADIYMGKYGGMGHSLEVFLNCKGMPMEYKAEDIKSLCPGNTTLGRIDIADERFKTIKGIGLGSSLDEFLESYYFLKDYKQPFESYFPSRPNGGMVIAETIRDGMSFEFNIDSSTLFGAWEEHVTESLPRDAKITSIWVDP